MVTYIHWRTFGQEEETKSLSENESPDLSTQKPPVLPQK